MERNLLETVLGHTKNKKVIGDSQHDKSGAFPKWSESIEG